MRATGIVRRIDELGRVVIPKEIRRTLRIREGDPLEIFTDHDGEVVLKKYSPIGEIASIAKDYTDSLYRTLGHVALISDRDAVVSSSGAAKREYVEKALSPEVDQILQGRQLTLYNLSYNLDHEFTSEGCSCFNKFGGSISFNDELSYSVTVAEVDECHSSKFP
jgi:AbrB family transcriptional regulator (stage V sporulation protein T)